MSVVDPPGSVPSNAPGGDSGVPFWKMSGSGNDFIVIDARETTLPDDLPAFVRAACHRRHGVGADGVVLIHPPGPDAADPGMDGLPDPGPSDVMGPIRYRWEYLNADGSGGEFCGNGAMCGARFAALRGLAPVDRPFAFWTPAGRTVARVPREGRVLLRLAPPGPVMPPTRVDVEGVTLTLHPVTVGVPHAVLVAGSMDAATADLVRDRFVTIGRAVRWHPAFALAGTNLDLVEVRGDHDVRMRTYERGVEDETLACGSGAVAVSLVTASLGLTRLPVHVVTTGGPALEVATAGDAPDGAGGAVGEGPWHVTLGGEARVVATGTIEPGGLGGYPGHIG